MEVGHVYQWKLGISAMSSYARIVLDPWMLRLLVSEETERLRGTSYVAIHSPLQDPPSSFRHFLQVIIIVTEEGRMTELAIRIGAEGMGLKVRPDIAAPIRIESDPLRG